MAQTPHPPNLAAGRNPLPVCAVAVEILAGTKLQRVHKDARHHAVAMLARETHQIEMPFMQIAHGWHKSDAGLAAQACAQVGGG